MSVPNKHGKLKLNVVLSNSFGFGGHNVCLAFPRGELNLPVPLPEEPLPTPSAIAMAAGPLRGHPVHRTLFCINKHPLSGD